MLPNYVKTTLEITQTHLFMSFVEQWVICMHCSVFSFSYPCTAPVHRWTYLAKLAQGLHSHNSSNKAQCIHCVNIRASLIHLQALKLKGGRIMCKMVRAPMISKSQSIISSSLPRTQLQRCKVVLCLWVVNMSNFLLASPSQSIRGLREGFSLSYV